MSQATHPADRHDLIRVHGARVNNLKDVTVELPKRRLTVFTGVSGSGKSSLVFGTVAAESQRLINETYSAFVQAHADPGPARGRSARRAHHRDHRRSGTPGIQSALDGRDGHGRQRDAANPVQSHRRSAHRPTERVLVQRAVGERERRHHRAAGGKTKAEKATFNRLGGMCPRCEGMGSVSDFDLTALYDDTKSLNEGALTIPGYSMDGWYGRIYRGCGYFDPDKPIKKFTKRELHDLLYREPTKIKVDGVNLTYAGLIPQIQKSFLAKDRESMQPHIGAFVDRAITFTTCPECDGTRLAAEARSSKIDGRNIADVCAMQISDLADWVRNLDDKTVAPLLTGLRNLLDAFVDIGLGYLSLDRPSGTLSGERPSAPR